MTDVRIDEDTKYLIDRYIQGCKDCKTKNVCNSGYWSRVAVVKVAILLLTQDKDCC